VVKGEGLRVVKRGELCDRKGMVKWEGLRVVKRGELCDRKGMAKWQWGRAKGNEEGRRLREQSGRSMKGRDKGNRMVKGG
jgi:hypothetical protein